MSIYRTRTRARATAAGDATRIEVWSHGVNANQLPRRDDNQRGASRCFARCSAAGAALCASSATWPAMLLLLLRLPGECWAQLCVYLDLRALSALRATSRAVEAALMLAPLDCWVDLRCSAKGQRTVSPAGLRALRRLAGGRLRSVDLHGCTQLSCPYLASAMLLQEADSDANERLAYLGMGDVRLLSPGDATPDPSRGMGRFLELLMSRCANLTRLDLSGCRAVDGHAIETLAACMDDGLCQLRWLALDACASSIAPVRSAKTVGSHPLTPLARHAHKLYELGLGAFLHFDDSALDAALLHPSVDIAIQRAEHVSEAAAADLPVAMARLRAAQPGIGTRPAATAEADGATPGPSSLRVLRLHSSRNLRMTCSRWRRHCFVLPHLVDLDLSLCPRLGTEVFDSLLHGVPILRRLNLSGCDTLTDVQVLRLFATEAAQHCAAGLIDLNLGETSNEVLCCCAH